MAFLFISPPALPVLPVLPVLLLPSLPSNDSITNQIATFICNATLIQPNGNREIPVVFPKVTGDFPPLSPAHRLLPPPSTSLHLPPASPVHHPPKHAHAIRFVVDCPRKRNEQTKTAATTATTATTATKKTNLIEFLIGFFHSAQSIFRSQLFDPMLLLLFSRVTRVNL